MSTKMDRKELKGPDRFEKFSIQIVEYAKQNKKHLYMGGAGVLALCLIGLVISHQSNQNLQERLQSLYSADVQYKAETDLAAKKKEELEKQERSTFLSKKPLKGDGATTETEAEKLAKKEFEKQLKMKLDAIVPDRTKSLAMYQQTVKQFAGKKITVLATFKTINILVDQKKYAECIAHIANLQKLIPLKGLSKTMAYQTLAFCNESMKNYDQALQAYQQLTLMPKEENPLATEHKMQMGRIYTLLGKKEESKKLYEDIVSTEPNSRQAKLAEKLMFL